MVTTKPLKVLVCLAIASTFCLVTLALGYTGPDISGQPGIQGEALSADPLLQPAQKYAPRSTQSTRSKSSGGSVPSNYSSGRTYAPVRSYGAPPPVWNRGAPGPGQAYCPPQGCPPSRPGAGGSLIPPLFGMFSPLGMSFGTYPCGYLPRQGCKQVQLNAKLWYAKLNPSTIVWGTNMIGGEGTELDLNRDLGISKHNYIPEYEIRCQIRRNWGVRFGFMPLNFRDNSVPVNSFYFGSALYPAGLPILTKWDRYRYSWDLVYDWFQGPYAVSSLFLGYSYYDDKISISNSIQSRSRSTNLSLAQAGASMEKVIRNVGSATASLNCKWTISFLESYLGLDGYAAGRVAVNMDCGRFAYLECGWRWIMLDRDYASNADKTSLDGLTAAVGVVF